MTRLEKRIAFDMILFFITLIVYWLTYQEKYNIMDKIWQIIVSGYLLSSMASIYASIVTNKYLKDFCILISFLRFSAMLLFVSSTIFGFDSNFKGPHVVFISISTVASFILSKSKLNLQIRNFITWLNLG